MAKNKKNELGTASINIKKPVVAGSFVTCRLTYTAGFYGIDDSGTLKIAFRFAGDYGIPQFDDPRAANYTTVIASNNAKLLYRWDKFGNTRPWQKTIYIRVIEGYLKKGDRITVTIGDKAHGSPGWRMQTFAEDTFELKVLVDRFATFVYEEVRPSPTIKVIPGVPVRLTAVGPSVVRPRKPFTIRARTEDAWGNVCPGIIRRQQPGIGKPGVYRLRIDDKKTGLSAMTNPICVSKTMALVWWADLHGQSEETVGTNTVEDYFRFARDKAFLDISVHQGNDFQVTDQLWQRILKCTREISENSRFLAFPGYEWSGNTGLGGDRNVLYKNTGKVYRSCRVLIPGGKARDPDAPTAAHLFRHLKKHDSLVFAHVGGRFADLQYHDGGIEKGVEIHSAWGTFEWLLEDAFRLGYRVGIFANSDGHKGRPGMSHPGASTFGSYGGLTAVRASRLARTPVWNALKQARTFATTGARMVLDAATGSGAMPGTVTKAKGNECLRLTACGTAPIERIELRNGPRTIKTWLPYTVKDLGTRLKVVWSGAEVRGRGRQVDWDGELKVTGNRIRSYTPINFYNREKQCRRIGKAGLAWESITTGGMTGVILNLEKAGSGTLCFSSGVTNFKIPLKGLGTARIKKSCGGLRKKVEIYRLPDKNQCLDLKVEHQVKTLRPGDNPFYFRVEQEDGHLGWSSPIYIINNSGK